MHVCELGSGSPTYVPVLGPHGRRSFDLEMLLWRTGISLWPYTQAIADIQEGQNLTIWLHSSGNFPTDTTKVACARKVKLITAYEVYRHCMNVTNVRYVSAAVPPLHTSMRIYRSCV